MDSFIFGVTVNTTDIILVVAGELKMMVIFVLLKLCFHPTKKRPNDFKRKILSRVYTNRKDLLEEEYKWLSLIKEELNKKYYNLHNHHFSHWSANEQSKSTVGQKISKAHKSNPNHGSWLKGKTLSEETKEKISKSTSVAMIDFYKNNPRTEETKEKIRQNNIRLHAEGKIGIKGKNIPPKQ